MKKYNALFSLLAILFLAGCTTLELAKSSLISIFEDEEPKGEYKVGKPYRVEGRWYYPKEDPYYVEEGTASWYGADFHHKATANGERFDKGKLTAAHRTLPLPSVVKVTNLNNGKSVLLRVNDRGPFAKERILDVSEKAAEALAFKANGHTQVRVEFDRDATENMLKAEGRNNALAKLQESYKGKSEVKEEKLEVAERPHPAEQKPKVSSEKGYFVQVGSFNQLGNGKTLARRLQKYNKVRIAETNVDGSPLFRVQMGPFMQLTDADNMLKQIRGEGYDDAVIISY